MAAETEPETAPGMVARVNYRREGAGDLVRYIERGDDRDLRNEAGRSLSDRQVERETRRVMNEQLRNAPSARYVYGVHEDTDHRHAHIALTGLERDLAWDGTTSINSASGPMSGSSSAIEKSSARSNGIGTETETEGARASANRRVASFGRGPNFPAERRPLRRAATR